MSETTKTDWKKMNRRDDKEIDYSDIPKTDSKFWEDGEMFLPHKKVNISISIDEDLALWLKAMGKYSNNAINSLIRAYYLVNNQ